ncbi:PoNe immunity protein domain-containing protein [Christiangramia sp. ASW11-125]|uniref:PoNe immunity protein domain-containing protein n=1 Tax=Christiangramia sp. ASW11-125 TaxID=3400701 RepID=UPI003AAF8007
MEKFDFQSTLDNFSILNEINIQSLDKDLSPHRRNLNNFAVFSIALKSWIARYSKGEDITELSISFEELNKTLKNRWNKEAIKVYVGRNREELNQLHYDNYVNILWFFSISILLESEKGNKTVSTIIKECEVQDLIFNYYINNVFDEDQNLVEESYTRFFMIPQKFKRLREIILEQNLDTCKIMIEQYLKKYWLKSYNKYGSEMGLESTKTRAEGRYFYGFWAFEVAAVAKLKGFGEEEFKHLPYFPTFNDR